MNKEFLENSADAQDVPEENNYQHYLKLGGIINKEDYGSALSRAKGTFTLDKTLIINAKNFAKFAGIELNDAENTIDPRIILYGILRRDVMPKKAEEVRHHHSQMSDQRIFMEALRMSGDVESVDKMIRAYPHISFIYREEEESFAG